nr:hypothetical protein [Tanacetum cinerariifolium]
MNLQKNQQVAARDEKWVLSAKRVKISAANLRLETTVSQKEETFHVVIDIIKNSTCFKDFTISTDVPEIFMQQFWYIIKKEYRLAIPDVMLNDAIKQSESYKMFIKYSTESEPEPAKKKIATRRVVKKKVIISDDNIIPDLDIALELGKYISLAKAEEEEEAAKQVYDTHARSPKPITSNPKLKDVQSLTPAEKEATDIMQALKESKKTNKRHAGTGGSSKGTERESEYSEEDPNEEEDIYWIDDKEDEEKKLILMMINDEEMLNAKVEDTGKGDAEVYDVAKADAEKTEKQRMVPRNLNFLQ